MITDCRSPSSLSNLGARSEPGGGIPLHRMCGPVLLACLILLSMGYGALALAQEQAASEPAPKPKMHRMELGSGAAFSPDGILHAVTKHGEHVLLYRSADDGAHWDAPVVVNANPEPISADGENRPKIAFASDGGILVSWTRPLAKRFSGEIRLARGSADGRFAAPITVHRDRSEITHRFESMAVTGDGKVVLAWIDKRDLEAAEAAGEEYRGAAIYAAVSDDGGRSFRPEIKIADHSCQCCRLAIAVDTDGLPLLLWRHVFEPNERDHALAKLQPDGSAEWVRRATFDGWKIDACPHHGPSLAVTPNGVRHAVWFNHIDGVGHVFYGRLIDEGVEGQRKVGGARAAHADLAAADGRIGIVWKEFDGERTQLYAEISEDSGASFRTQTLASTLGASDQPRMLTGSDRLFAFWRTEQEGMRGYPLP